MKKYRSKKSARSSSLAFIVITIVGLSGVWLVSQSLAASTEPYGYADSCALESGKTVVYGWGADAQANTLALPNVTITVGSQTQTVPTNQVYRTSQINAFIDKNHAGDPKPGTYGFRAVFSGLYKGGTYHVSGSIINYGAGTKNGYLYIGSHSVDGDGGRPFFTDANNVPDACMPAKPGTPTPAPPAPAPNPTPTPPATPKPKPTPTPPPVPSPSADANGGAVAGTLAATITVPAGNAAKIHILYGTDQTLLSDKTEDKDTNNADVQFNLTGLKPSTSYSYQIVRTNSIGETATSGLATFATGGFTVVLHFVNNKSDPIAGVSASIKSTDKSGKSDKEGLVTFSAVTAGDYTVNYTYNSAKHDLPIVADATGISTDDATKTTEASLEYFVNVDKVSVVSAPKKAPASSNHAVIWVVLIILAIAAAVVFIVRKRRRASPYEGTVEETYHFNTSAEPLPAPADETTPEAPEPQPAEAPIFPPLDGSDTAPPPPPPSAPPAVAPAAPVVLPEDHRPRGPNGMILPGDSPEHMGLSLKEMVLRSMAETERQKRAERAAHEHPDDGDNSNHQPR